jgi:hypothetical protein
LNPLLDELESGNGGVRHFQEVIDKINDICTKATLEAKKFLASI